MLAPDTILQNRYQVMRLLAKGGMGAVYLAKDLRLNSSVALKETFFHDKRLYSAFEREAHMLANLYHPALPTVIDYFSEGEGRFLVMEFIPGDDLGDVLGKRRQHVAPKGQPKPFPLDEVLDWADQLFDVLEYLHTRQPPVIHRDIKPENLKLTARGQIILLDFGLAKGTPLKMSRKLSWGSLFGFTLSYAPLEQMQGTGTDPRSDLYSLAATLYHLLTGIPPIDAMNRATNVVSGKPDPLRLASQAHPQVPLPVARVLMQAMSQDRNQRPSSVAEMRESMHRARYATDSNRIDRKTETEPPTLEIPDEQSRFPKRSSPSAQRADTYRTTQPPIATLPDPPTETFTGEVDFAQESLSSSPDYISPNPETKPLAPPRPEAAQAGFERQTGVAQGYDPVIHRRSSARLLWIVISVVIIVIAIIATAILVWRSGDDPQPIAKKEPEKTVALTPTDKPDRPPTPVPMVEAMNYYMELEQTATRSIRSAGTEPLERDQRFRLHFSPRERGYLYVIAPGESDTPTLFLKAEPVAAKAYYQFPSGNNWIRVRSTADTIKFTVAFSPVPIRAPTFSALSAGSKLNDAEQKELRALSVGAKVETENNRASVKIPVSGEAIESTPLVFDIIIKRK